jgi:hypothetical protein
MTAEALVTVWGVSMSLRKIITVPLDTDSLVIFDEEGKPQHDAVLHSGMWDATWLGFDVKACIGQGLTACLTTLGEGHVNESVKCKLMVIPRACVVLVDLGEA